MLSRVRKFVGDFDQPLIPEFRSKEVKRKKASYSRARESINRKTKSRRISLLAKGKPKRMGVNGKIR